MCEPCRRLRIPLTGELHLLPVKSLVLAVEDVVSIESPCTSMRLSVAFRTLWATPRNDLIDAAARRFGIKATSAGVAACIGSIVDAELARRALTADGDVIRLA